MTYRTLLEALKELPEESLNMEVELFDYNRNDFYYLSDTTLYSELEQFYCATMGKNPSIEKSEEYPILIFNN